MMKALWILPLRLPAALPVFSVFSVFSVFFGLFGSLGPDLGFFGSFGSLGPQEHKRIVDLRIDGMTSSACYEVVATALCKSPGVERVIYWVAKDGVRTHVVLKEGDVRLSQMAASLEAARKKMKDTLRMEVAYALNESALSLPVGTKYWVDGKELLVVKETTVTELRKSAKIEDVILPVISHPVCGFVCPNGCSASDTAGRCPKCANELVKVEAPKKDG